MSRLSKILNRRNLHTTLLNSKNVTLENCPRQTDVLVIGGGAMGSSVGYWLKEKTKSEKLRVTIIEKDPTYKQCSTSLSVGGLRQQFSMPENVQMSMFGAEFIKNLKQRFGPDADVCFCPNGYLFLASKLGAARLEANYKTQESVGAVHVLLTKSALKERFPWLNVSDLELGCLGFETEGWFDPWLMLNLLKNGAKDLGTQYITAEAKEFRFKNTQIENKHCEDLNSLIVEFPNGELKNIEFSTCVIAAGCDSGKVGKLAKIGTGSGILSVPIPVERRKRYVFGFNCNTDAPGTDAPMVIDSSGAYFRRERTCFISGVSPSDDEEPETKNLDVDYEFFDDKLWPLLSHRVPAFSALKVVNAWGGFYEYNTFDQNGIIGRHPHYNNLYIATGFSGHGIQQSPAVGRAIAELILNGKYQTIDLTRLGFERLINEEPMEEIRII